MSEDSVMEGSNQGSNPGDVENNRNVNVNKKAYSLIISTFDEFYDQVKQKKIGKFAHFKVERKRGCCSYSHHFMLLEILKIPEIHEKEKNPIQVVIGHYTSSIEICTNDSNFGIGKFVCEIKEIKKDETCDPFDFDSGFAQVINESFELDTYKMQERLCEQLGEREYDFRHNNCEHAINFIISGNRQSDEAKDKSCCADFCTASIGEFKEVGLKVALIIAFVSSLAGSLIRYSYVSLIVAGTIFYKSHEGMNGTCSSPKWLFVPIGKNVITHAKQVLKHHIPILKLFDDQSGKQIIEDIESTFDEAYICKIAYDLASDAILKTIYFSVMVSLSFETIFFVIKLRCSFFPLRKRLGWKRDIFMRKIVVRFSAGYSSIFVGIFCGFLGQAYIAPPALYFFLLNLVSSFFSRYILSLFFGMMYDCCFEHCKCCECCKSSCSSCIRVLLCRKENPRSEYEAFEDETANTCKKLKTKANETDKDI
ncbi:Hypothetical predicted protein [Mytilus galloprovincialis]|uniref:LRAT domain-containing protein n=1 Tax=Mytilus galloprovincialis TaxID=29158 RepID=A0A8B6FS20_MYTGA|nr:Hypothetical predicted protein [Mytilus galloprovincialis]